MLIAAAAALVGAAVQSASGFGFALVLSPALFATLEPEEAVGALLLLGLALNLLVLFEHGRPRHVDWRGLAPMLAAALPGLVAGAALLAFLSKQALQVGVGVAVIAAAGWQLRRRAGRASIGRRLPPTAGLAVGFASGALTTSISVNGPPMVLWLEAHGVRPEEFRATLAASFLALNLAGAGVLLAAEGEAAFDLGVLPLLLVLVAAGYLLGALAFRRLDRERFFTLALALVLCTGAASVVAGAGGL
jgi:uncharacterized protein